MKAQRGGKWTVALPTMAAVMLTAPAAARAQVANGGFEAGTTAWSFNTDGAGTLSVVSPGQDGTGSAGRVTITTLGSIMQLMQEGISLVAGSRYTLSFWAYATGAHDVQVSIFKTGSPFTNYGLLPTVADLPATWGRFEVSFIASGFAGTVSDARLQLWFVGHAQAGDLYHLDDVSLVEAAALPTATVSVDAASPGEPIPNYHQYANVVERGFKGNNGALDVAALRELGLEQVRVFSVVKCWAPSSAAGIGDPSAYTFDTSCFGPYGNDGLIDYVLALGAQPIISLHHRIPDWLLQPGYTCGDSCTTSGATNSCYPRDLTQYRTLLTTMLRHYKTRYPGFVNFDVYNEPQCATVSPDEYAAMHEEAVRAALTVNAELATGVPAIEVGGPGPIQANLAYLTATVSRLKAASPPLPFAFASWHYYSEGSPNIWGDTLGRWDAELRRLGATTKQFAGEFGYLTNNDSPSNIAESAYGTNFCQPGPAQPTARQVAANAAGTAAAYHSFLDAASSLGVWFRPLIWVLNDYPRHARSVMVPNRVRNKISGACEDGKVMPTYNVMKFWGQLAGLARLAASSDAAPLRIGVSGVAAIGPATVQLLVYNNGAAGAANTKDVTLSLVGLPPAWQGRPLALARLLTDESHGNYMVDPAHDRAELVETAVVQAAPELSLRFMLAAGAVTLITLTRTEPADGGPSDAGDAAPADDGLASEAGDPPGSPSDLGSGADADSGRALASGCHSCATGGASLWLTLAAGAIAAARGRRRRR
ncbi:MAG: carbohydrate binding domain-containing protein [Deltaproteobacteria bacterium]|nr:carbohydrate binding domain-containing protein [Deltaproteobacteria bacterium]